MPEGLMTEDGKKVDIDSAEQEFARTMAAPEPGEPEHAAPPKRLPEPDPDPVRAPHGWTEDGDGGWRPKKAAGRPKRDEVKADKARATAAPAAPVGPPKDYREPLAEMTQGLWMAMAGIPVPVEPWGTKLKAQAAILKSQQAALVNAFNLAAQNNDPVRRGIERLTGPGGWMVPFIVTLMPFGAQTAALWRAPMGDEDTAGKVRQLAAQTDAEWSQVVADFQASVELAGQAA